ncbi:lysostaphin resistance A-like protein [Silvibacterium sp.]|uniref:CPBP family intramembrane glutamic endopeptidase n=1 Tax=Silvibacterium sp. TaxID=1964179 RepID=UPI0039E31212
MDANMHSNTHVFDPGSSGILAAGRFFYARVVAWAVLLFAIATVFFFASVFGAHWLGLRGNWFYALAMVLPPLACCIYAVLVHFFERREVREFEFTPSLIPEGVAGFVFGGVFIAAMWGLLLSIGLYTMHRGVWTRWFQDLVFSSYISAVLEELGFRAVLLRILARMWGVRAGVIVSSILFGLAHITHGSWFAVLGIILNAGLALGLLYVITGRLWMSMGMHLGYDFIETSMLGVGNHHGLLVSAPKAGAAAWLTGGSFGPDAAIPGIALGIIVNILLWRFAFRGSKGHGSEAAG